MFGLLISFETFLFSFINLFLKSLCYVFLVAYETSFKIFHALCVLETI